MLFSFSFLCLFCNFGYRNFGFLLQGIWLSTVLIINLYHFLLVPFVLITFKNFFKNKKIFIGMPGWLSWLSVWLLVSAQVMISQFVSLSPTLGSTLIMQSLLGVLSLSLSLSLPPLALSLSLSK